MSNAMHNMMPMALDKVKLSSQLEPAPRILRFSRIESGSSEGARDGKGEEVSDFCGGENRPRNSLCWLEVAGSVRQGGTGFAGSRGGKEGRGVSGKAAGSGDGASTWAGAAGGEPGTGPGSGGDEMNGCSPGESSRFDSGRLDG